MIIFPCAHILSHSFCKLLTLNQLFSALQCAHSCFSFVHHSLWVYYDTISLCTHLFSSICKLTNTASTLLCFELVHTISILLCPSQGVSVLWYQFPCAHIFSLSFASWLTPHQLFSALNWCTHSRFSPLSITGCECITKYFIVKIFSLFHLQATNTAPTAVLRCALSFVKIQNLHMRVSTSCMYLLFQCSNSVCVSKSSLYICRSVSKQIILTISIVSFFCFVVTLLYHHSL